MQSQKTVIRTIDIMSILRSHRKLPVSLAPAPLSPRTLKGNQARDRNIQDMAVAEIIALEKKHGSIKKVIEEYNHRGHSCVTRPIIDYRLKLFEKGKMMQPNGNNTPDYVTVTDDVESVSSLEKNQSSDESISTKKGGRPSNAQLKLIEAKIQLTKKGITVASRRLIKAQEAARKNGKQSVVRGTIDNIIKAVELELDIEPGTIQRATVKSRV